MLKHKLSLSILALLVICIPLSLSARHFARWYTTMGNFTADLRDEIVPITANNFISLSNSGFYDGLHFHRVVSNFVIQDGDPLGTGYGGPGYTIQDEFSPLLHHDSAGVLAMAHTSAPNSAGSQYYITLRATPNLDGAYAVFGKVFEGLDVVMAIGSVAVDGNSHPITNVVIDSLKILDLVINNVSPNPDSLVTFDNYPAFPFVVEAFNEDFTVQYAWYLNDVLQTGQTDFMYEPAFQNFGMNTVACVTSTSEISWTTTWQVQVVDVGNSDDTHPPILQILSINPNPFRDNLNITYKSDVPVSLSIFDSKGRKQRSHSSASSLSGEGWNPASSSWVWDGTDDRGNALPSGVYFVRLDTGKISRFQKCVLLR